MAPDSDVRYAGYERHTVSDGVELAYRVQGAGPTLAIVNSVLETSTAWRAFARRASSRYRVVTYDMRSQGRSSGGEPSYANHVADIRSLLDALDAGPTFVMGHSISTQICVELALTDPARVRALILVGPMVNASGAERRRRLVEGWCHVIETAGTGAMFDIFWPQILCDGSFKKSGPGGYDAYRELWVATTRADWVAAQMRASLAEQPSPPTLERVEQPTLLIAGEDDFVGTESALREAAASLPDPRVVRLRNVGHVPHLEAPREFEQAVDDFADLVLGGASQRSAESR